MLVPPGSSLIAGCFGVARQGDGALSGGCEVSSGWRVASFGKRAHQLNRFALCDGVFMGDATMMAMLDSRGGLGGADLLGSLTLGFQPSMLVSPWQPVVLLATLAAWAWVVSAVFDKHAARFNLDRERWGLIHCIFGVAAIAAAVLIPLQGIVGFIVGWVAMVAILIGNMVTYSLATSKDERVPVDFRMNIAGAKKMLGVKSSAEKAKEKGPKVGKTRLTIAGADKQVLAAPIETAPEYGIRTAAEGVVIKALESRASQIDIIPAAAAAGQAAQSYQVQMMVDGVPMKGDVLDLPTTLKIVTLFKTAAKLDATEMRKKQQGNFSVEMGGNKTAIRMTTQGASSGIRTQMLFNPEQAVKRKPEKLGLLEEQMAAMKELAGGKGLVLVTAPPDNGRTTLFYSTLGLHDAYTQTLQTVEMEPQLTLEGVKHEAFDPTVEGADYSTLVRSMLRRDPDVLGVAEVPDQATAKIICNADFSRVRLYAGLRAGSAMEAIEGWLKAVGDPALASKQLQGVVCGRLMRKLCTNCRVPYNASPEMLKKLGVAEGMGAQLFKKGGQVLIKNKPEVCPMCQGIGYMGIEAFFEVYLLDSEDRENLASGNLPAVKAALKKRGTISLQQAAIRKAVAGITSVEEVMRVTQPATAAAPAAANA
jgi:type II secretory ATPase GspE/PulE/Tfp pilus assembly ATPase PilB-like protein